MQTLRQWGENPEERTKEKHEQGEKREKYSEKERYKERKITILKQ